MQAIRCTINEDTQEITRTYGPVLSHKDAQQIERDHYMTSGNKGAESWDCTMFTSDGQAWLIRWDEDDYDAMYLAGEIDER